MSIRNEMRTKAVGSGRIQPMNGIENFESLSGAINEIAQDALQQDGVAHDYGTGPARAKRKALAVSQVLVVATKPVDDAQARPTPIGCWPNAHAGRSASISKSS